MADLTAAELVARIDSIPGGDPEGAHGEVDDLLISQFPREVDEAIERLRRRCGWWACA